MNHHFAIYFSVKNVLSLFIFFSSALALADLAPSPRLTKEQIRIERGIDDCKARKIKDKCQTMESKAGTCQWFVWWWTPNSSEKSIESGKTEYSGYVTQCTVIDREINKLIPSKKGPATTVKANKCLICM